MARLLPRASRNNREATALSDIGGFPHEFPHEQTLPEPFLPRFGGIQRHALQIRPDCARRAERSSCQDCGLDTRPTSCRALLESAERLRQHDFLIREVGAEWKIGEQSAGPRQNETLFQSARSIVSMQFGNLIIAAQFPRR